MPGIKSGRLLPTDEFSGDGVHWIALGRHHQLSRLFTGHPEARPVESGPASSLFFDDVPALPPGVEQQLDSLAGLLRDING